MSTLIAQAVITCLFIPIFGAHDPHSTCLTRPQMERRMDVMKCGQPGESGLETTAPELSYVITGDPADVAKAELATSEDARGRYYVCILKAAIRRARGGGNEASHSDPD